MSDDGLSLLPLCNLKHIQMSGEYVLGTNMRLSLTVDDMYVHFKQTVPPSIRKLDFDGHSFYGRYDDDVFLSVLRRVALDTPSMWPRLEEVRFDVGDSSAARHIALQRIAAAHGVRLRAKIFTNELAERSWGIDQGICWADVEVNRIDRNRWRKVVEKHFGGSKEGENEVQALLSTPQLWDLPDT